MSYNYDETHSYNNNNRSTSSVSEYQVRNSRLEPTAPEFRPATDVTSTGAVKKKPQNQNRRYNRYGSGRFSNNTRHDDRELEDGESSRQSNSNRKQYYEPRHNYYDHHKYREDNYQNNYKPNRRQYDKYVKNDDSYQNNVSENGKHYNNRRYTNQPNWRKFNATNKDNRQTKENKRVNAASQRERLEDMLNRRQLECLVCCEKIKNNDKVWSCTQCYNILHLDCTVAWAKSSQIDNGWRCPACQNVCTEVPHEYRCYCNKIIDPKPDNGVIAHSCGEICLRKGRNCDHKCTILCHPGPCPDCNIMVSKACACGATQSQLKCSTDLELVCDNVCNKLLNCGLHHCTDKCHWSDCTPCSQTIQQECYCGKVGRRVQCTANVNGSVTYSCGEVCNKVLSCKNHKCTKICHEDECEPCINDVSSVRTCPCGKKVLEEERKSCLDPIPCCDKVCGKYLKCGQPNNPHVCQSLCHLGDCPVCPQSTLVRCRCGHMDKELPCKELVSKADDARCEKKCTKKRLCGKHRCNQRCCIEFEHICPLPCNHQLTCGQHRCQLTCHRGHCPPCLETSFEELYCECGSSVIYPPIPCGTKPPVCNKSCIRPRPCGHEPNHSCHPGPCPPCTVLCKRWCYGKHEQRSAVPCHQQEFSCGLPCGKAMACGRHKCVKACHADECPLLCKQPCTIARPLCGHPCLKPCHDGPCPESICRYTVPVTCPCGLQKSTRPCLELTAEFRNIEMANLKDKMGDLSKGITVDLSDVIKINKPTVLKVLECTDECKILERNRRLAIGLQIRNPDLSQKLTPRYTDFMRTWAKKDPHFCSRVHEKLSELVQLAKQSKQASRSYSFESMNRDKRHFVHEYCEHFGCESVAYDSEPNRNVVATANRDKSWLPSMSLLEVIQRENGQRKVPGPILNKNSTSKSEPVSLKLSSRNLTRAPPGEMEYFD